MDAALTTGLSTMAGACIGALVTYFFSTRNLESIVSHQATTQAVNAIKIHKEIEHKESSYDIVDNRIRHHKEECGAKLDDFTREAAKGIRRMELKQVQMETVMIGMNRTITEIAQKLQIVQKPSCEDFQNGVR